MTAPGQVVHIELWRVGDLDQEDAVLRNSAHGIEIGAAREHVEAVEHQPDGWMIGAAHHLPGVAIVVDVRAPRERLERNTKASPRPPLAKLAEVGRRAVNAAQRIGRHIDSAFLRRWVGCRWTISARLIVRLHTFCRHRWTSGCLRGTWPALLSRSLTGWICRR